MSIMHIKCQKVLVKKHNKKTLKRCYCKQGKIVVAVISDGN